MHVCVPLKRGPGLRRERGEIGDFELEQRALLPLNQSASSETGLLEMDKQEKKKQGFRFERLEASAC